MKHQGLPAARQSRRFRLIFFLNLLLAPSLSCSMPGLFGNPRHSHPAR